MASSLTSESVFVRPSAPHGRTYRVFILPRGVQATTTGKEAGDGPGSSVSDAFVVYGNVEYQVMEQALQVLWKLASSGNVEEVWVGAFEGGEHVMWLFRAENMKKSKKLYGKVRYG